MNYKLLQRTVGAGLLSGALFLSGVAHAALVTNKVPLLGYANQVLKVYRAPGNMQTSISIPAKTALIQIMQIRTDGWAYGSYPISGGRRANGWFKISDIQPYINFKNWEAKSLYDNYRVERVADYSGLQGSNGIISRSDALLVVGQQGQMLQIIYKQKNSANWRIGWVAAKAVQKAQVTNNTTQRTVTTGVKQVTPVSQNTTIKQLPQNTSTVKAQNVTNRTQQNNTTASSNTGSGKLVLVDNPIASLKAGGKPLKGDANGDGQITLTDVSKINFHNSGGEKIDTAYLSNADVNEDGKIDEDDAAIVRNVYMGLDAMSNYPSNYSQWSKTASKTVSAYDTPALKRQRNTNERVDKGDNVTVYSETDDAYYVEYPTPSGNKKRWVSKEVFSDSANTNVSQNTASGATQGFNSAVNTTKQAAQGSNAAVDAAKKAAEKQKQQQSQTIKIVYPSNGYYSIQPMCAPGKELTVQGAGTAQGTNVCISTIGSDRQTTPSHQKWYIERIGNSDWYKILAENSKLALNVHNGAAADWTNVSIWPYSGNMHEFRFYDIGGGYYLIQGHIDGSKAYVLDVYYGGSADGTNVQSHSYNNSASQKWKLVKRNAATLQTTPVFKQFTATAKRTVNAYDDSALTNWDGKSRIDYNDTITATKEEGNAYFVRYPIRTAPYYKEKWVTKDILKEIPQGAYTWPVPDKYGINTIYYYNGRNGADGKYGGTHSCRYYEGGKGKGTTKPYGIDVNVNVGTPVYSVGTGVVITATDLGNRSFGKYIEIDHGNNRISLYAHLSKMNVSVGDQVNSTTLIGLSGKSGPSGTGAHLHFEMSWQDPYEFYKKNIPFTYTIGLPAQYSYNRVWVGSTSVYQRQKL